MNPSITLDGIKAKNLSHPNKTKTQHAKISWNTIIDSHLLIKITAVFLTLAVLGVGGYEVVKQYEGKILPKVMVAGINVGGKTPEQAKRLVLNYIDTINKTGPTIKYQDQTINSTLPELGATFDIDQVVNDAFSFGRSGNLKTKLYDNSKLIFSRRSIDLKPNIDEAKLNEFLSKINQTVAYPAQDAKITITNGQIAVTAEKDGLGFDKDKLKDSIQVAINEKITQNIDLEIVSLKPIIFSNNTINAQKKAADLIALAPIALTYQDQNFIISKNDIGSWIEFKAENNELVAFISDQKVSDYSGKIAGKIAIKKVDREIIDGTGQVLEEGRDGIGVDTKSLTNNITNQLNAGVNKPIAVGTYLIPKAEVVINPHAQPGRFAGRYIDVNLSEQTLYAFDGFTLVNQFLVSTGKTGPTPTGTFYVYGKTRAQTMDGPGYSLPNVEWISWWSGDYSIHGTYWHNNFGHPMSHGCVNASNANAEWIYNWDDIGTPVYIHW